MVSYVGKYLGKDQEQIQAALEQGKAQGRAEAISGGASAQRSSTGQPAQTGQGGGLKPTDSDIQRAAEWGIPIEKWMERKAQTEGYRN